jgi:KaiC/GvpD/RAD55 family RecA-like ATPase
MSAYRPYPGLKGRVFLDYPLDILLNRQCSLKAHEAGLVPLLESFEKASKQADLSEERWQELERTIREPHDGHNWSCWTSPKTDWAAIAGEPDVSKWRSFIHGQADEIDKFDKALTELSRTLSSAPNECELRMLGLHLMLTGRTIGSLQLPDSEAHPDDGSDVSVPCSGNIVIEGTAGSGKSTLALQIALAFTHWPNAYHAVYLALEENERELCAKACDLFPGKDLCTSEPGQPDHNKLQAVAFHTDAAEDMSPSTVGQQLYSLLTQPTDCPMRNRSAKARSGEPKHEHTQPHAKVLFPGLSPRSVLQPSDDNHPLFWERFRQIERLLMGAKWLRSPAGRKWMLELSPPPSPPLPDLRVICVDSLNTFGDRRLHRDELCRLFDLFRQYGVVGVCTVESGAEAEDMASSDLVDVLIRLQSEYDLGYFLRYIEIAKSRYTHQVYGRHPFKIRRYEDVKRERSSGSENKSTEPPTLFQAIKIFPSVHHVVGATEPIGAGHGSAGDSQERFDFGIKALEQVLSPMLMRNMVLAIVGERTTYKTPLSRHFLMDGLCGKAEGKAESCLLIRLHEQVNFIPKRPWMVATDLQIRQEAVPEKRFWPIGTWLESGKLARHSYRYSVTKDTPGPWIFELALKGGAILPEELLQYVRNVMRHQPPEYPVRRVVIDDVSTIGASYPFLRRSQNAGDLFLSAFVHVMRNYGTDVVMLGTTTGLAEADEMVNRACALADEVLTCEYCDVFGHRYVTVRGSGLAADSQGKAETGHPEMVPAVISPKGSTHFEVDGKRLVGLAGFGTGQIHRPGLTLQSFQENDEIHGAYNDELRKIIGAALGVSMSVGATGPQQRSTDPGMRRERSLMDVSTFGPRHNQAYHDGLALMKGPMDKTIVATVDEFFTGKEAFCDPPVEKSPPSESPYLRNITKRLKGGSVMPYYANVLLVAYHRDLLVEAATWFDSTPVGRVRSWHDLKEALDNVTSSRPRFVCDNSAAETGACLLLDVFKHAQPDGETRLSGMLKTSDDVIQDLVALTTLAAQPESLSKPRPGNGMKMKTSRITDIPRDASVYVLWYSQLRNLLRFDYREGGELAEKLRIAGLPGGGATGDWYIGVVGGSVSASLGWKLVEILCAKKEEHKRLERGVGLPTTRLFYEDKAQFMAWPGSDIALSVLEAIHGKASSRSEISGYQEVKTVLYGAWQELLNLGRRSFSSEALANMIRLAVPRWRARVVELEPRSLPEDT